MIEKADPRLRAVVIPAVLALVVSGVVLIAAADTWRSALIDWVARDPARSRSRSVAVSMALAAAVIAPVLAAAAYLWHFGVRVARDRRLPPRGMRLVVDMVVQEGDEAQRRGRMLQVLAVSLGTTTVIFAIMFWRLIMLTNPDR